jgi:hypothetical protein
MAGKDRSSGGWGMCALLVTAHSPIRQSIAWLDSQQEYGRETIHTGSNDIVFSLNKYCTIGKPIDISINKYTAVSFLYLMDC